MGLWRRQGAFQLESKGSSLGLNLKHALATCRDFRGRDLGGDSGQCGYGWNGSGLIYAPTTSSTPCARPLFAVTHLLYYWLNHHSHPQLMGPPHVATAGTGRSRYVPSGSEPVRELNLYLQSHPTGNLTPYLTWGITQSGPDNQKTHYATAKSELPTVAGGVVGQGKGSSLSVAKREAAMQAMQHFQRNGVRS
ncbi:hypothetical protein BJV74DRAFT_799583 [Russula compacta]|nr:hypothetical protein BJV74DRAFT_799583 [Russula compacta]